MKYIYILLFIAVFLFCKAEIGYTAESPLYTHLTYMFQHAGVLHLSINALSFIAMFRTMQRFISPWLLSACIIPVSFAVSFTAMYSIPTVGASAMTYTMVGMFIGLTLLSRHIQIASRHSYRIFLTAVAASLTISACTQSSNFILHLSALVAGILIASPIALYGNRRKKPKVGNN